MRTIVIDQFGSPVSQSMIPLAPTLQPVKTYVTLDHEGEPVLVMQYDMTEPFGYLPNLQVLRQ